MTAHRDPLAITPASPAPNTQAARTAARVAFRAEVEAQTPPTERCFRVGVLHGCHNWTSPKGRWHCPGWPGAES